MDIYKTVLSAPLWNGTCSLDFNVQMMTYKDILILEG